MSIASGHHSNDCHPLKGWFLIALVLSPHVQACAALPWSSTQFPGSSSFAISPFRQPSAAVVALTLISLAGGDPSRRLAEVELRDGWEFPGGTTIRFENGGRLENNAFGSGWHGGSPIETIILAGYRYQGVVLFGPGGQFSTHLDPTVRAVAASTPRHGAVTRDDCPLTTHNIFMAMEQTGKSGLVEQSAAVSPLATDTKLDEKVGEVMNTVREDPYIQFMHGGSYKLCYTADGTFTGNEFRNALIPPVVTVIGVSSSCASHGCLKNERWDCYFGYRGEAQGECRFDFRTSSGRVGWGIKYAGTSRLSWTSAWKDDETLLGALQGSFPRECSDTAGGSVAMTPEIDKFDSETMPSDKSVKVDFNNAGIFPAVGKDEKATKAFTVTACYCPNFDSYDPDLIACSSPSEYIQSIGKVYFWTIRICDYVNFAACGDTGPQYMRFIPQEPFVIRIQCPPGGGCSPSQDNRIKIIRAVPGRTASDEKDSYDLMQRCKTVVADSDVVLWPQPTDSLSLSGGDRVDYKIWREKQARIAVSMDEVMEVCYCDSKCGDTTQFFKAGSVRSVLSIGLALNNRGPINAKGDVQKVIQTFDVMGKPGTITLGASITTPMKEAMRPYDSVPFSGKALVKLMSFDRTESYGEAYPYFTLQKFYNLHRKQDPVAQKKMDTACSKEPFNPAYTTGPSSAAQAKKFMAEIGDNEVNKYLTFSGVMQDSEFAMKMAGVFAICYCAVLTDQNNCKNDKYWLMSRKMTIRGPDGWSDLKYPTDLVVRIQLHGWGFGMNDTLRFVATTQTCTENDFDPIGNQEVRMNCPSIDASGCRPMNMKEDLYTEIETSNSSSVYIEKVTVDADFSTLTFTKDVHGTGILKEGDQITIEEGSVLLSANSSVQWSAAERYIVSKLTGVDTYTDDPTRHHMLAQYLSEVGVPEAQIKTDRRIPVGWSFEERPRFSFTNPGGRWLRRNRLRTHETLKAVEGTSTLKVCWGVFDEGLGRQYFADAGRISFKRPDAMTDVGIHLTTREDGAKAPVVLSFIPKQGNRKYSQYGVETLLRIVFRDVGKELEPLFVGSPQEEDLTIAADDGKLPSEASQITCGKLFLELWSNDEGGFPMPRGCYYTKRLQDAPNNAGTTQPLTREYFMSFEPHNGLKSRCYDPRTKKTGACFYMMVFNAHLKGLKRTTTEVASVYTMCAEPSDPNAPVPCDTPYNVWEMGRARPTLLALRKDTGAAELGHVEMAFRGHGWYNTPDSNIPQAIPTLLDFKADEKDSTTGNEYKGFQLRATPKDPNAPITSGFILRLFMTPFTQWDLGAGGAGVPCITKCIEAPGGMCNDNQGGNTGGCSGERAVKSPSAMLVNLPFIKLIYPNSITSVKDNLTAHVLDVTKVRLPSCGFFASKVLVQMSDAGDNGPSAKVMHAQGKPQLIIRFPPKGATSGMLLIEGQAGAPKPFQGEKDNALIARIVLGATLRWSPTTATTTTTTTTTEEPFEGNDSNSTDGYSNDSNSTQFTVRRLTEAQQDDGVRLVMTLPPGYSCNVVDDSKFTETHPLFLRDDNDDNYRDYYHGKISGGTWIFKENVCTYVLAKDQVILVGQVFFVRISTLNPRYPIEKVDPKNVWTLGLFGPHPDTTGTQSLGDPAPFLSLEEEVEHPGWAGNVAVLGKVSEENLQPTAYAAGRKHDLEVFFRANRQTSNMGYVLLDSPDGFDFGNPCIVGDVDEKYYADWHATPWGELGKYPKTRKLGRFDSCVGERWDTLAGKPPPTGNFTRARIRIHLRLKTGTYYAFKVRVENAANYSISFHNQWRIWTQDKNGYYVEGAYRTLLLNPERMGTVPVSVFDRSWGTSLEAPARPVKLDFGGPFVIPTSMTEMPSLVTVYPLRTWVTTDSINLRIIAPDGYEWMPKEASGFFGFVPGVTCDACLIYDLPKQPQKNEIIFEKMTVSAARTYGFQMKIRVPNNPPFRSSNRFLLEFGYDTKSDRLQGEAVDAPPLRAVYDVAVMSLCNALGFMDNVMDFHVHTVTALAPNEGFVFWGDRNTELTELFCWPEPLPGSLELPKDAQCSFFKDSQTGLPVMILSVTKEPFVAGRYDFSFKGVTNTQKMPSGQGAWTIGTYRNVHNYPNIREIDKSAKAYAPQILRLMPEAGLLRPPERVMLATFRDDRPKVPNNLLFFFRLSKEPLVPPSQQSLVLALRGPPGFFFEEECLTQIFIGNFTWGLMNKTNPCYPGVEEKWCPQKLAVWPDRLKPTNCQGIGNTAKVSVPNTKGWKADKAYIFRIGLTNPAYDSPGKWALDFGTESAIPFEGFGLSMFEIQAPDTPSIPYTGPTTADGYEKLGLYAASTAESEGEFAAGSSMPLSILFRPSIKVPALYNTRRKLQVSALPPEEGAEEGFLELQAPEGFIFPLRKGSCEGLILERAERAYEDEDVQYHENVDQTCTVYGKTKLVLRLVGEKPLQKSVVYRVLVNVVNPMIARPAEPWYLSSFKREYNVYDQYIPLDQTTISGYSVTPKLKRWSVDNLSKEYNGLFKVRLVRLNLQFPQSVKDGDFVTVSPPMGFTLGPPEAPPGYSGECLGFRWPSALIPLPNSPPPVCSCSGSVLLRCSMVFTVAEGGTASDGGPVTVLVPGQELEFEISTFNPRSAPDPFQNYWQAAHVRDGDPLASGSVDGWPIRAQLTNVMVGIVGLETRANAISDLLVEFVPVSWARSLELVIRQPKGFNFYDCKLPSPLEKDRRTKFNRLVAVNGRFLGGNPVAIFIAKVILGDVGGETIIDLRTYRDDALVEEIDQKLSFLRGFRLPGAIDVISQRIEGLHEVDYYERNGTDAPLVLFPARVGELARLELLFTITKIPLPGEKVVLQTFVKSYDALPAELKAFKEWKPRLSRCAPEIILEDVKPKPRPTPRWHLWEGIDSDLVCDESKVNVTDVEAVYSQEENPDDRKIIGLLLTMNASDPYNLPLVYDATGKRSESKPAGRQAMWVEEKVQVRKFPEWFETKKVIYRLRVWFKPSLSVTFWRLNTQDEGTLPTNTNDGLTECLRTVHNMDFNVIARRTPPQAVLRTNLKLKWGPDQALTRLEVVLPPNFTFFRVQKVNFLNTDRVYAPLQQKAEWWADFIVANRDLDLRINSPAKTPTDKRWLLRALTEPKNKSLPLIVTGWGIAEGFTINQMEVFVRYAPIERFTGWVLIEFRVLQDTISDGGAYVIVRAPEEFRFACSPWLTEAECAVSFYGKTGRDRIANLTLDGAHVDGEQLVCSFLLELRTPEVPPDDDITGKPRYWDVQIFDAEHECVDAAFLIPSPPFVFGVYMNAPKIAWTNDARPGERSIVTVELVLTRRVRRVKSILVSLPSRFRHDITRYKEFRNLNRNFPIALDRDWRVFDNRRWVKILIDDMNSTKTLQFLPPDNYRWQFPIMVPTESPASTSWFLSLCLDYLCEAPDDAHVLASFPIPGIGIGAAGSQTGITGQGGASRLSGSSSLGVLLSLVTALRAVSAVLITVPVAKGVR